MTEPNGRSVPPARGRRGARLDELLASSDPDDRLWVAHNIATIRPEDAADVLRRLLHDGDEDVRQEAQQQLTLVGDDGDRRTVLSAWLRQLHSESGITSEAAIWGLVRAGDPVAIEPIREFMKDARGPWKAKAGEVAIEAIHGNYGDLAQRLQRHDHPYTKWLAVALMVGGSPTDVETVRKASVSLPDDGCRGWCRGALKIATARGAYAGTRGPANGDRPAASHH
jgi:hypothetical protein